MTNRNEMITAFDAILTLAAKVDKNQQKVNFLHYMHGRADDAMHWQGFVDQQRARLSQMHADFAAMTAHLNANDVQAIQMEVVTKHCNRVAA